MKNIFTILILGLSTVVFSQNHELGKVTVEELKEKVCPTDTSAAAAVLFNVGKTYFNYSGDDGFELITEISTKIKVYKKEGYDFANHSERIYVGGNGNEKVLVSRGITYNLVGDKIEKSKLSSDGEFTEKVNKFWNRKKITMPNVKVGSIIEYKITISSPYTWNFPEWEFQKEIPVGYSEYSALIPEYFIYNTHMKGYYAPKTEKSSAQRSINFSYTEDKVGGMMSSAPRRINTLMNFQENKVTYKLENVPALKDEGYVNNISNYQSKISYERSGTRFPNSPSQSFNTDWESVAKLIYDNDNFGPELIKTGYFEKDVDALLKGKTSSDEKINLIFNFVKSRMNWTNFTGITCDAGVKKAYLDKKGNAAEINLMLTAILRYVGFEANPVLISTRSNGIYLYPSSSAYNYVITGLELNNQIVLFDATSKYSQANILPIQDLNWFGRIIRKNGSSAEINLMPNTNSKDVISIMGSISPQGEVTGKIREQYFDYNAFIFRQNNNEIAKDSYIEKLEKRHQGLEIGEYDVQNKNDLSQPVVENYDFKATNSVEIIGDKMYFSPFLFFAATENLFKQETREYPIDFVYPNQDKYNISIKIPEGYAVETLPQAAAIAMPENMGSLKYIISNNAGQIQVLYTLDINQAIIGSEYYEILKGFYKEIVSKQTEKIVLKKV
ncbi:DUF3857 domain-containing protein [Flavobacterium sp.]|uniref:DUF3857 domain-containing protein n=1 Tax=Flavobacterium sp. TaxID=239 RepID=UPI0024883888|nr:DUF3857 domain-containing protein [Flavobacterium sp.]MDI1318137.1 DUF3857 domain-containing protein [Flavobacterium sp.]